ncbi:MAG: PepSY domain-containing protein [Saprospiraceae bacterium]
MSRITKSLRKYRVYHKYLGLALAILLLVSALTGIFLAWKKDVAWIQPPTQKGVSQNMADWKPMEAIAHAATAAFYAKFPEQTGNPIDRIDVRPGKGIAKVLFEQGWWEVQVDCTTAEVLFIARRHSDWIEQIHDGSIISDLFKVVSMNLLGLGLLILLLTGLWLWYGPRLFRKLNRKR